MISIMCAWISIQPFSSLLSHLGFVSFPFHSYLSLNTLLYSLTPVIIFLCAPFTTHFFPSLSIPYSTISYVLCCFHLLHLFIIFSSSLTSFSSIPLSYLFPFVILTTPLINSLFHILYLLPPFSLLHLCWVTVISLSLSLSSI